MKKLRKIARMLRRESVSLPVGSRAVHHFQLGGQIHLPAVPSRRIGEGQVEEAVMGAATRSLVFFWTFWSLLSSISCMYLTAGQNINPCFSVHLLSAKLPFSPSLNM